MKIQFKVYDEKNKEYQNNPLITGNNGNVAFTQYDQNNFTILQYTGLRSKYGSKIYEHDIVYDEYEEDLGEVLWDNDLGRWIVIIDNIIYSLGDGLHDRIMVVANYPTTIEEYRKENEVKE